MKKYLTLCIEVSLKILLWNWLICYFNSNRELSLCSIFKLSKLTEKFQMVKNSTVQWTLCDYLAVTIKELMALFFHIYLIPSSHAILKQSRYSISILNTSFIQYSFNYIILLPGWLNRKQTQSWLLIKENSLATQTCVPTLVRGLASPSHDPGKMFWRPRQQVTYFF